MDAAEVVREAVDMAYDPPSEAHSALDALKRVVAAARAYRVAEKKADGTGEWEQAREAAVVLDKALRYAA